ncbi:MerR family transcriptional regulator [Paenibacillus tritici]|uniref:MerR family transcriptional regulator n=1 Tax=Paenibacillus tritici TaxID=1873425 RepID=A0ABX2DGM7_9BACL|nr:MerR family transcriptional regulator [Paenibacillus tritici]NQX43717.1 MerR family transcriptional regulator [Paenibacillus tritici]
MEGMTRGKLARQAGVSAATIRYYEDSGILPVPERTAKGYRIYSADYLVKLKFIKDAKSLGYSLNEIQAALALLGSRMDEESLKVLVRDKITEIDEKVAALRSIQSMLASLLQTPQDDIQNYLKSFEITDSQN